MVYLLEAKLPEATSVFSGLTSVYGIGKSRSFFICKKLGFASNLKIKNLSSNQVYRISRVIESLSFVLASDLRRINLLNNTRLVNIKSYRGLRRRKGFPIRGQRTHTNAKTSKKNRK